MRLKPWVRKLHLWLAFLCGLPLILVGVTGALLVFPQETEDLFVAERLAVQGSDQLLQPSRILEVVADHLSPVDRVVRLHYPARPEYPLQVDTEHRRILVDPYRGEVLLDQRRREGFMQVVLTLHVSLMAGEVGRHVTGLSACGLMLLCVSGWWLWWPVGRWNRGYFGIATRKGWKRFNFDLHRATGLYLGAFLFLIALTGATMAYWSVFTAPVYWLTGSPYVSDPYRVEFEPGAGAPISPDRALEIALNEYPELEPRRLYLTDGQSKPYRVFLDPPGEHEFRVNEVRLEMHPYTGEILQTESPDTMSDADRILRWVLPLHFGTFGGWWSRWLYLAVTLSPLWLAITGGLLWWNRYRKRSPAGRRREAATFAPRFPEKQAPEKQAPETVGDR